MVNMDNVNFIVKMRHYSERYGADGTARGFIRKWQQKLHQEKMIRVQVKGLDGNPQGSKVMAYIHQGQWLAECECGGHEFVDPADPVFFCWGCVNRSNGGWIRPVVFPENWEEIESLILARPVNDLKGATDLERAGLATPAVVVMVDDVPFPLVRSWKPDESVDEIRRQNSAFDGVVIEEGKTVIVEVHDGV